MNSGRLAEQNKASLDGIVIKFENGMLSHSFVVKENIIPKYGQVIPQISSNLMLNTNMSVKIQW